MDIKATFHHLGLQQKEIEIYLALLELREATILEIAKRSEVKRPTVYVVIKALEQKGFVIRSLKGKKSLYTPHHPKKLITEAEFRLKELTDVMPQLESMFQHTADKPRIMMYEGKDQLDRAYDDYFAEKGEVVYMGTLQLSKEVFPKTFIKADYVANSSSYLMRELLDESPESLEYAQKVASKYRLVRFIPKKFLPFEVDIGIFGNKTLITSVKKEYFTICIESPEIAKAFKTLFEVMWSISKAVV